MRSLILLSLGLLALIVVTGLTGGQGSAFDTRLVTAGRQWFTTHPQGAGLLIWLTHLGGSFVLVPLTLLAALVLWLGARKRDALLLLATTMSGRAAIELLKLVIDRPRPSADPYPVYVSSQSFPSGHAGNSMITYLAIAVFALPQRWRGWGLGVALMLAFAIGATRPALGVHWPTDVIGGWALGILWVAWWSWFRQRPTNA